MTPPRRLFMDVVGATVGLLVLVGLVVFLVDGVEQARAMAVGGLTGQEWGRQVLARLPGRMVAVLPVVGAVAAAQVLSWWQRTGRIDAWMLCGGAPSRLAVAAAAGVLLVAGVAGGLREVAAPWSSSVLAGQGTWVAVHSELAEADLAFVRAEQLLQSEARDVSVAWLRGGSLVGRGSASRAVWAGDHWQYSDASAVIWTQQGPRDVDFSLPSPRVWGRQAVELGMDASVTALLEAPMSPTRQAWLGERLATPVGAGLLALLAMPVLLWSRRWGVGLVLCTAGAWRVAHMLLVILCGRGALAPSLALFLALLPLALAAFVALLRLERGSHS